MTIEHLIAPLLELVAHLVGKVLRKPLKLSKDQAEILALVTVAALVVGGCFLAWFASERQ